ncbi:GspH/FimT family protein [Natronospira bacteriovora]|uniref:Type II secretion system protein H n=1 Tax=Natronospira bacteriovora TaxID=3069753 RepID=A0ABU0W5U8_9GAMM|nr:GspH/FimT family protein [Natronospira sp. AB-CW4]MDQ2069376.1 GspH/FimT family protein [Natronospira sp. AB-CW4]
MGSIRVRGMTLLELLIVLVIAGLLLGLGLPSLDRTIQEARMTAATNRLVSSLHFARDASIRLGVPVTLCPTIDGLSCERNTQAWSEGWLIYRHQHGGSGNRLRDPDQILRVIPGSAPGLQANRQAFTLRTDGRRSTNGTLLMCRRGETTADRAVIINVMGRVRSTRDPDRMPSPEC